MSSKSRLTVNGELEIMLKEAVVAYFIGMPTTSSYLERLNRARGTEKHKNVIILNMRYKCYHSFATFGSYQWRQIPCIWYGTRATYNGFFPKRVTTKSIKYAGRKWKKMTQRVCKSHELLILPSGNQMASLSGFSYRCFRPTSRTRPHVMGFSPDTVRLQTSGCFGLKSKAI